MRYQIDTSKVGWRDVNGEAVLIHFETSYYYSLNPTGTLLWRKLDKGGATREELIRALTEAYGQPEEAVSADVDALLSHLQEEELLLGDVNHE